MLTLVLVLLLCSCRVKGLDEVIDPLTTTSPVTPTDPATDPPADPGPETQSLPPRMSLLEITHTATFEMEIGQLGAPNVRVPLGNFTVGLFGKIVPKTVDNFLRYVRGQDVGKKYQGTTFHRIIRGFIIQGGDLTGDDGQSGFDESLWFDSENFDLKHVDGGWVSVANCGKRNGKDTNGSQFFITLGSAAHALDGRNVVFGKVLAGMSVIRQMESVSTDPKNDKPIRKLTIKSCSATDLVEPYANVLREPVSDAV